MHFFRFINWLPKYPGECFDSKLSGILGLKKLHFLLFYIHSQPIRPHFPTVVATPILLKCCSYLAAKAKQLYLQTKKTHIKGFMRAFNIPGEILNERAHLKANK